MKRLENPLRWTRFPGASFADRELLKYKEIVPSERCQAQLVSLLKALHEKGQNNVILLHEELSRLQQRQPTEQYPTWSGKLSRLRCLSPYGREIDAIIFSRSAARKG